MVIKKPFRQNKETSLAPPETEGSNEKILNVDFLSALCRLSKWPLFFHMPLGEKRYYFCNEILCLRRSEESGRQGIPVAVCNGLPRGLDRFKPECVDRLRKGENIEREMDSG